MSGRFPASMRQSEFDPYGEPIAQDLREGRPTARPGSLSRGVLRVGVGLFWILVIGIVAARVAFFDPDVAAKFGSLSAITTFVRSLVGA
ncbi:hypothetical protein J2X36_004440 [Methylobacterium sp. BE186]|uniref:hypothetical protein n=1 Tax=Methylobacterium sp. BE186 TaxID=2817715 RepID=UPI00286499AF|nr:hypothetical protein [Methylobacterium sp. BE186]MDR7039663.1 hypothetical protein [Methylobacterium sp. BE186]